MLFCRLINLLMDIIMHNPNFKRCKVVSQKLLLGLWPIWYHQRWSLELFVRRKLFIGTNLWDRSPHFLLEKFQSRDYLSSVLRLQLMPQKLFHTRQHFSCQLQNVCSLIYSEMDVYLFFCIMVIHFTNMSRFVPHSYL